MIFMEILNFSAVYLCDSIVKMNPNLITNPNGCGGIIIVL
jgi:hypothetical protein